MESISIHLDDGFRMNSALQLEMGTQLVVGDQNLFDLRPQFALLKVLHVADEVEAHLGSREGDADAVGCLEESDLGFTVAPHQRQNDDVVFFALKIVHHGNSHVLQSSLAPAEFHHVEQLTGVRRQDGDLVRFQSLHKQMLSKCKGHVGLVGIQTAPTLLVGLVALFRLRVIQKEDVAEHSRNVGIALDAFVIQQVSIDGWDDEAGHFRAHSMLNSQNARLHSVHYEPFKQRHVQVVFHRQFVNGGRRS